MGKALRVFISHTSELARSPAPMTWVAAAERAVREQRHAGVDMAHFGSSPATPENICREEVERCQVWVGVLGSRYGSIVRGRTDISYTEMEFEIAAQMGMPRLAFLIDDGGSGAGHGVGAEDAARQDAFRRRVKDSGIVVSTVTTPVDLFAAVFTALHRLGDLRADPRPLLTPPPVIPLGLRDDHQDADSLRERLLARQDPVMALVGEGGAGKTALVSQAFQALLKDRSARAFGVLDYMSASGHLWITGDTILGRLFEAVGSPARRAHLEDRLRERRESWYDQVEEVLSYLDDDVLIVIDQVENLLDDRGLLAEPTLNQLVSHLSRRGDHRVTILLVSSRQPAGELVGHRRTAIWELPRAPRNDDEAVTFLRQLAPEMPLNLAADPARAVELAGRRPRTLELVVAAFTLDPELTVDDLLPLARLSARDQVAELVATVVGAISQETWQVVLTAAVLGLPSTAKDLADTLGHGPGRPTRGEIGTSLDTLRQLRIVRSIPNDGSRDSSRRYYLPAAEADCVIRSVVSEKGTEQQLNDLRRRAAAHLARSRGPDADPDVKDLALVFREIELRLQLGPTEYPECVALMGTLANGCLRRSGRRYVLMPWRRRLLNWHGDERAWRSNVSHMVAAAVELDELDEATGLLDMLWNRMTALPRPQGPPAAAQLASDEQIVLGQLGFTAFHDGRLLDAEKWHEEELRRATTPHERVTAHLGLGVALRDQGQVERAAVHLGASWRELADAHDDGGHYGSLASQILLVQAELARLRGELSAAQAFVEQACHRPAEPRTGVQLHDLRAALLLEESVGSPDADSLLADAVEVAERAAEEAAKMGVVDATRTAHAFLSVAHLRRGDAGLELARRAATSAAGFFGGKRGLSAHIALGMVHLQDRHRSGAEQRARACFYDAVHAAEQFSVEKGRPYWVWDAIGEAETGLHLCRVPGARSRAIQAFQRARAAAPLAGAVRRAVLYLDTLAAGNRQEAVADILAAARGQGVASVRRD